MKNYKIQFTATAALAVVSSVPVFAGNMTILPARMLTPTEASQLPNTLGVVTLPVTFKTAAAVNTSRLGVSRPVSVARGNSTDAGVYSGYDGPSGQQLVPAPQPAPPVPSASQQYDFKKSGDAVQAWATMTSNGVPFVMVKGFGQFSADGHVSWRTTLPLPSGQHKVYLKVTVPSTTVFGNYDSNGPGRYHLRAHADVLVNGHSVYFGEALRFNETDNIPSFDSECAFTNTHENAMRFRTYGQGLGFSGNVDGGINTAQPASQPQTITLLLGNFDSTETVDVQFVLNAEASIENKCCLASTGVNKGQLFCSAANVGFDYEAAAAPVFYVQ